MAPNHYTARLQLSVIMRKLGRPEDALLALAQVFREKAPFFLFFFQSCYDILCSGDTRDVPDILQIGQISGVWQEILHLAHPMTKTWAHSLESIGNT